VTLIRSGAIAAPGARQKENRTPAS
jgi:hypothetical protein